MEKKERSKMSPGKIIGKILLTVIVGFVLLFVGMLLDISFASWNVHIVISIIASFVVPVLLLPLIWVKNRKKYMKFWLIIFIVTVLAAGINFGISKHKDSITLFTSADQEMNVVTSSDAFVFVVHQDNPVDNLTIEQVKGIYSGEITNWSEVGGEDMEIVPYQCTSDSENQAMMEVFMGETPLMNPPTEMGYGDLYGWEEVVISYRNKPESIGFCFTPYLDEGPKVKVLSINGIAPEKANIIGGTYPIVTPASFIEE